MPRAQRGPLRRLYENAASRSDVDRGTQLWCPTLLVRLVFFVVAFLTLGPRALAQRTPGDSEQRFCRGGCLECREVQPGLWQKECITATCVTSTQRCVPPVQCGFCSVDQSSPMRCSQDCFNPTALNPVHFRRACAACPPMDLVPRSADDDVPPGASRNPRWDYLNGVAR